MSTRQATAPPLLSGSTAAVWFLIGGSVALAIFLLGRASPEGQMYLVMSAITAAVAAVMIPRAVTKEPSVTVGFLALALAAHVFGSLLRYIIIQQVYHGIADANGYFGAGSVLAPQFRSLSIPPLQDPYFGTPFVDWTTGLMFAFTGASLLGGFVVHSVLSFVGAWYFYKAFVVSFPEGDHRLYAFLIFFLPSMWYWPSSLGKDALIMLFLGIATYGFALLLRGHFVKGVFTAFLGLTGTAFVRPPIAAALAVAGAAAFLLRPARTRSPQVTALMWVLFVPLLSGAAYFAVGSTTSYLGAENGIEAYEQQRSASFVGQGSDSNFEAPSPFTPAGFPLALLTVNFRPFPWEAGGVLPAATALEGIMLIFLLLWRRREVFQGLRMWRRNGMVVLAIAAWVGLSVILSALTNFGLLARQRTQVLPFLLMLPCMVLPLRLRRRREEEAAYEAAVASALASASAPRSA
jgi:hypothetical protein